MKHQRGLSLISTLIVGVMLVAALLLGLKLVPVFTEYMGVQKSLNSIVKSVDPSSAPAEFRRALSKQAEIDDFSSIDAQTLVVTKNGGAVSLEIEYRREVPLFANVSLAFDFAARAGAVGAKF